MFSAHFLAALQNTLDRIDQTAIEAVARDLAAVRARGGRLFIVGVGGGAGHASHAVNDFRKICGFEAYSPSDNVSELTARINDEGWENCYAAWLEGSRIRAEDGLLVFSVGGGSTEPPVSINIVRALQRARAAGSTITGVVGRSGGYTAEVADSCCIVPTVAAALVTPLVEAMQAVIWHLLVAHPALARQPGRWEQLAVAAQ